MTDRAAYPTSFWLDDETRDLLDALAKEHETNRSAIVRMAIHGMKSDEKMTRIRKLVRELSKVVPAK